MQRRQVPSLLPDRMEPETNRALRKLASLAQLAADRSSATRLSRTESEYESVRAEAKALNARQGWAGEEEFDTLFPSLTSWREVDALNVQFPAHEPGTSHPKPAESLRLMLLNLASWATGVRLAGETLDAAAPEE